MIFQRQSPANKQTANMQIMKWMHPNIPSGDMNPGDLPGTARVLLVPVSTPPRMVTLEVLPSIAEVESDGGELTHEEQRMVEGDSHIQTSAMKLLCSEEGCERYRMVNDTWGYVGVIDCCRDGLITGYPPLHVMFLGADNGFPIGKSIFPTLPPNETFGGGIRGPVIIYASTMVAINDIEHELVFDIPEDFEPHFDDIVDIIRSGILRRYKDAGLV
jgi:hypothetical protein